MNQELEALLERWPMATEFALPKDSLVVIIGAYKGITMELIDELYHPRLIMGYEPQLWAANLARERLNDRSSCRILGYGLGNRDANLSMGEFGTDACSFINVGPGSREQGAGQMKNAGTALRNLLVGFNWQREDNERHEHFDLVVINIEGGEFELLPYLDNEKLLERIDRLAVQFHLGFGNDDNYIDILNSLDEKFKRKISELPSWGYWVR